MQPPPQPPLALSRCCSAAATDDDDDDINCNKSDQTIPAENEADQLRQIIEANFIQTRNDLIKAYNDERNSNLMGDSLPQTNNKSYIELSKNNPGLLFPVNPNDLIKNLHAPLKIFSDEDYNKLDFVLI